MVTFRIVCCRNVAADDPNFLTQAKLLPEIEQNAAAADLSFFQQKLILQIFFSVTLTFFLLIRLVMAAIFWDIRSKYLSSGLAN